MNVRDLLARARSQLGRGTRYQLGAGGYTPSKPYPGGGGGHAEDGCDCSGFVCWCLGISRHTTNEYYRLKLGTEWISTVSMFRDCGDSAGLFESLEHPRVGCIVVYPDGAAGKGRQGHVGIVTALRGRDDVRAIIHCSQRNAAGGDAIQENLDRGWVRMLPSSRFGWFVGVRQTPTSTSRRREV